MRRLIVCVATFICLAFGVGAPALATGTTEPPPEAIDEQGGVDSAPVVVAPLNPSAVTTIPSGCAGPSEPQVVFVGTLTKLDDTTAIFSDLSTRAGSLGGYLTIDAAGSETVSVRYGREAKFLSESKRYLVGAASAINSPILVSKVRESAELFGGGASGGVSDQGVACPDFEDPIRTLNDDGTSIDTGIFSPLLRNQWQVLLAIAVAVGLVLALLTGAVIVKQLFR